MKRRLKAANLPKHISPHSFRVATVTDLLTQGIAVICHADGTDLAHSRHFWLPEGDDPVPPTLAALRVMAAGANLFAALQAILALTDASGRIEFNHGSQESHAAKAAILEATGRSPGEPERPE